MMTPLEKAFKEHEAIQKQRQEFQMAELKYEEKRKKLSTSVLAQVWKALDDAKAIFKGNLNYREDGASDLKPNWIPVEVFGHNVIVSYEIIQDNPYSEEYKCTLDFFEVNNHSDLERKETSLNFERNYPIDQVNDQLINSLLASMFQKSGILLT